MSVDRAFAVALTIPDNEAYTALAALQRLGVAAAAIERSTIWMFRVDEPHANGLLANVRGIETIFNPNKHRIATLERADPRSGEVWIASSDDPPERERVMVAGRELPGVRQLRRRTAWRLFGGDGEPVAADVIDMAVERLLCNPAYERSFR